MIREEVNLTGCYMLLLVRTELAGLEERIKKGKEREGKEREGIWPLSVADYVTSAAY